MQLCTRHEQVLLDRAGAGDPRAFDSLFALHQERIRAGLRRLLGGDRELIEETVGTVFLRAFVAFPQFRRQAAFSTWLFRIAIREANACRRSAARDYLQLTTGIESDLFPAQAGGDPEEQYLRGEEERRLRRAIQSLPEPYRTPVLLRYVDTMTSIEIAQRLDRPEGTVRYQISRGLKILRERFF